MKGKVVVLAVVLLVLLVVAPASAQKPGMGFLADVTIPDDTVIGAGEVFTKTWKLENTGDVDWLGYSLQFASGDEMGGVADPIAPAKTGGISDVTVVFAAPEEDGTYTSWWKVVDETGNTVGSQFYTRIVVGTGESAEPQEAQPIEELIESVGTLYNMNDVFTLNGMDFRVYRVYRNEAIWGSLCSPCTVDDGVWAVARFNVTNHTGYSAMTSDHVKVYMMDDELNVYDRGYTPSSLARKATISAGAHFGNKVPNVWDVLGAEFVDAAMVHVEPVPADADLLYVVFEDMETGERAFVRLQRLSSKTEMLYEGEFINAPARE